MANALQAPRVHNTLRVVGSLNNEEANMGKNQVIRS